MISLLKAIVRGPIDRTPTVLVRSYPPGKPSKWDKFSLREGTIWAFWINEYGSWDKTPMARYELINGEWVLFEEYGRVVR